MTMRMWRVLVATFAAYLGVTVVRHQRDYSGPLAAPGAATLATGDVVYYVPEVESDGRRAARVLSLHDGQARLRPSKKKGDPERETPTPELVAFSSLRIGDVVDAPGVCPHLGRVREVVQGAVRVECRGAIHDVAAEDLELPAASDLVTARASSWVGAALATLCLLLLGFAARALSRSTTALRILDGQAADTGVKEMIPAPVVRPRMDVLRCESCGALADLSLDEKSRCKHCGSPIEQPPAYRELRLLWQRELAQTKKEDRAILWAEQLASPVFAWSLRALAPVLFVVPLTFMVLNLRGLMSDAASMVAFFATFPLLFSPLPLLAAANGVSTARSRLRPTYGFLSAAVNDAGAMVCRSCGAPLLTEYAGVATVCFYCGAQNLLRDKMDVDLERTRLLDKTMTVTIGLAVEIVHHSLWERCALAILILCGIAAPLYAVMALSA